MMITVDRARLTALALTVLAGKTDEVLYDCFAELGIPTKEGLADIDGTEPNREQLERMLIDLAIDMDDEEGCIRLFNILETAQLSETKNEWKEAMTERRAMPVTGIVLDSMQQVQLLAAFQVLSLPNGSVGATHAEARIAISKLTKVVVRRDDKPMPPAGCDLNAYLAWHLEGVE